MKGQDGVRGGADLGEGAAQLDVRRGGELSLLAHGERAVVQAVQVGHHQQQVGRRLHRQEAAAGDVHAQGVVEALDGGAHGRLQLDDVQAAFQRLERHSGDSVRAGNRSIQNVSCVYC